MFPPTSTSPQLKLLSHFDSCLCAVLPKQYSFGLLENKGLSQTSIQRCLIK